MKLVIDISEQYFKECKNKSKTGIGSYTHIANGTPLEKVLEDIKGEIEKIQYRIDDSATLSTRDVVNIEDAIDIIDKHIGGKEKE